MSGFLGFDPIASGAFSAPPTPSAPITVINGALASQFDNDTVSADGTIDVSGIVNGSISSTLDNLTIESTGNVGAILNIIGSIIGTTDNVTISALGSVSESLSITGALSETIDNVSISSSGIITASSVITGALAKTLGDVKSSAIGGVDVGTIVSGSAAATLEDIRGIGFGAIGEVTAGTISVTLDDVSIAAEAINVTAPAGTLSYTFSDVIASGKGTMLGLDALGCESALQYAIYEKLSANALLMSIATGIYDDVPQKTSALPYVTIGEDSFTEWDTDTASGCEAFIEVHTWSDLRGRKEIKAMQNAIKKALHRVELVIDGYNFIGIDFQSSESFVETDGKTRHGVQVFKVLMDEIEPLGSFSLPTVPATGGIAVTLDDVTLAGAGVV